VSSRDGDGGTDGGGRTELSSSHMCGVRDVGRNIADDARHVRVEHARLYAGIREPVDEGLVLLGRLFSCACIGARMSSPAESGLSSVAASDRDGMDTALPPGMKG
jgi:hypothetical protein